MRHRDGTDDVLFLSPTEPRRSLARMVGETVAHFFQGCRYQPLQVWDYTSERLIHDRLAVPGLRTPGRARPRPPSRRLPR